MALATVGACPWPSPRSFRVLCALPFSRGVVSSMTSLPLASIRALARHSGRGRRSCIGDAFAAASRDSCLVRSRLLGRRRVTLSASLGWRAARILAEGDALMELADRLEAPRPVEPIGVALAKQLASDANSPLRVGAEPATLHIVDRPVTVALDLTPGRSAPTGEP